MLQDRPAHEKRPSMSDIIIQDMIAEQKQFGISDHGTIHDLLDTDDSSDDSTMVDTMYGGGSSSTSLGYNSGSESSESSSG